MATLILLTRIGVAAAIVVMCTLLPFLPGRYEGVAIALSVMAHVLGTVGIVLVPVGLLLLAAERTRWLAGKQNVLALVTLVVSSFVWGLVSLGALVQSGLALGLLALGLWGYAVRWVWPVLRLRIAQGSRSFLPAYLIVLPVLVASSQLLLVGPAVEFSRNRAIRNSGSLIADIERYRTTHGRYPSSLLAVHNDYSPGVIGISEYRYEPSGDAYNLLFEQFRFHPIGTRELVVYNPRDEQAVTSHAMDRLQLAPEQLELEQRRGHYAMYATPHPHWKYFWFD